MWTYWELQLKGVNQQGKEPLDMEAEDAVPLIATTKQCSEDHDWEHYSVCDNDLESIFKI
jgi:hypothetical protein